MSRNPNLIHIFFPPSYSQVRSSGNSSAANHHNKNYSNRVRVINGNGGDDGSDEEKEIFEKTLAHSPFKQPKRTTAPLKVEDYDETASNIQTFNMSDVYSKPKSQDSYEYFEMDRSRICDLV